MYISNISIFSLEYSFFKEHQSLNICNFFYSRNKNADARLLSILFASMGECYPSLILIVESLQRAFYLWGSRYALYYCILNILLQSLPRQIISKPLPFQSLKKWYSFTIKYRFQLSYYRNWKNIICMCFLH